MSRTTGINISYGLIDTTAKKDTTVLATDKQEWIDPQELAFDGVAPPKVATLEDYYWKLDGTFDLFPDNPQNITWGLWSKSISGVNQQFSVPITIELKLKNIHESSGLTFEFNPHDNSYCNRFEIQWFLNNDLVSSKTYTPESWDFVLENAVPRYNKIIMKFYSMNKPHRYLKIQNISHGQFFGFDMSQIVSAKIYEEVDFSGLTLSYNTFDIQIFDKEGMFNIENPQGLFKLLQKNQPLYVKGEINGSAVNMGTFFTNTKTGDNQNIVKISAIDGVGILQNTNFNGGMYKDKLCTDLLDEIFTDLNIGYYIHPSFNGKTITGYLAINTHKNALQMIAEAIGGYVSTTRSGTINILPTIELTEVASHKITNSRHEEFNTEEKTYTSTVEVVEYAYTRSNTLSEIMTVSLDVGVNKFEFSKPYEIYDISSGETTNVGVNFIEIQSNIAVEDVLIRGYGYDVVKKVVSKTLDDLEPGEIQSTLKISNNTLINANNSLEIAERNLQFAQYRVQRPMDFILQNEKVGDLVAIETDYNIFQNALCQSLDTDLTGGFISSGVFVSR